MSRWPCGNLRRPSTWFPTVVYGYVSGNDGPQILTERDFDSQGVKVRAGLDFGYGVIDHRGAYLNEGN